MRTTTATAVTIVTGLAVGVATSLGQARLDGAANALVNSVSAWLVAPFCVGVLMATRRGGAVAGLGVCVLQVVGYYGTAHARGFANGPVLIAFWTLCAVLGGPLFGAAGHLWRGGDRRGRGLGGALLPAVFAAEGLWLYLRTLHDLQRAGLWLGFAAASAAILLLRRPAELRWMVPALGAALVGEMALSGAYVLGVI